MARFNTTRWSLIAEASGDPSRSRAALEQLCRDYRPPVLAYLRQRGYSTADAEDLTQDFFLQFLERGWHANADPERGRFRALLLSALRRFVLDSHAHVTAQKRGGKVRHVELPEGAGQMADQLAGADDPEQAFMQGWLGVLLERGRKRLQKEYSEAGKGMHFERIWRCLDGPADSGELGELAAAMGLRSNTLAVQLHRARTRLRQLIRLELLATVGSSEDLELELRELRGVAGLSGRGPQ